MVFGEGKYVGMILECISISMQVLMDAYHIYNNWFETEKVDFP